MCTRQDMHSSDYTLAFACLERTVFVSLEAGDAGKPSRRRVGESSRVNVTSKRNDLVGRVGTDFVL